MADIALVVLGWLHLLAVVVWVGGTYYFYRVFQPSLAALPLELARKMNQRVAGRVVLLTWLAILGVAATGLLSASLGGALTPGALLGTLPGNLLLGLAAVFGAMALLAWLLAKTVPRTWRETTADAMKEAQAKVQRLARAQLLLALVAILLEVARAGL